MSDGDNSYAARLEKMAQPGGYTVEHTVAEVAGQLGMSPLDIIKLDANENFFMPKGTIQRFLREVSEECDLRIYPQEEEDRLKELLSDFLDVAVGRVVIGNGSDELIQQIAHLFLEKGDQAISVKPTFPMYKHSVLLSEAEYLEVSLNNDFSIDIEGIMSLINSRTKLLFLCSPNNPTANQFPLNKVVSLAERFPGIVVIDEAYGEFAEYSAISLLDEFENLIVLRTFSKAFGLAGLRLGYAIMNPELATPISKRLRLPYPISSISLRMGLKMLSNANLVKEGVEQVKTERTKLVERLNQISGVKAFDSQTNFILLHTNVQSNKVHQYLLNKGIMIKNLGTVLNFRNCLRTTVGEPEMNEQLLEALKEICGGQR